MRTLSVFVVMLATLVPQSTAQLPFYPWFHLSQYYGTEGEQVVVRLSAPILTNPYIPAFNGSIEVDVTAEDLPDNNHRYTANFGIDYLVNTQNTSSRTFILAFQSKQANSTEHVIFLSDDECFEGPESFRLRIVAARIIGQAAAIFRAQDGLNYTVANVYIEDDDFISVNFTTSGPITVTEGEGVELRLSGEAFGCYSQPIAIRVYCGGFTGGTSGGVFLAYYGSDYKVIAGRELQFTDIETFQSFSKNHVLLSIINDDIAEPCKSLLCTLQGGALDAVRGIEPNRVTIRICDDDTLIFHWAKEVYEFAESEVATVELVTDSNIEEYPWPRVRIQGFPKQITNGHPNHFPPLVVPGPDIPEVTFDAKIERATLSTCTAIVFGNAQVTKLGRTDVVNTIQDFRFTSDSKSAFENFTIIDDDVLEFDELFIAEFDFGHEILNSWNARKEEPSIAYILIRDDDYVEVNFNQDNYTVDESEGQVSVSLHIDGKFFYPVWAIIAISSGTATDPGDYSSANRYNVTFLQSVFTDGGDPAPSTLSSPIIIISLVNDDICEDVEFFWARIVVTSDRLRVRIGPHDAIKVFITDEDIAMVNFNQGSYTVAENDGQVSVSLRINERFFNPVWAIVEVSNGTATDPGDYSSANRYNVTFPFTDGEDPVCNTLSSPIIIDLVDDDSVEDVEFFWARIAVTSDRLRVRFGLQDAIKVFITDDDHPFCTFQHCTTDRAALCTVVGANGNCTNQATSCTACYFAREERPLPDKCTTDLRNYSCSGLTGSDLKECLQTWGECVKKAFKDVHGKTPRRLRKKRFFKCPEFPCN